MACFVTGGTGLIGRNLVDHLLARGETVYLLLRPGSEAKLEGLRGKHLPLAPPHVARQVLALGVDGHCSLAFKR